MLYVVSGRNTYFQGLLKIAKQAEIVGDFKTAQRIRDYVMAHMLM